MIGTLRTPASLFGVRKTLAFGSQERATRITAAEVDVLEAQGEQLAGPQPGVERGRPQRPVGLRQVLDDRGRLLGRRDPTRAAQAFDKAFTVLGKIDKHAPKGPWSAYFELLTHFGDGRGFFTSVSQGLDPTRRERERGIFPQIEGFSEKRAQPEKRTEDTSEVKLENVGTDVDAKIQANLGALPYPMDRAGVTINQDQGFKPRYETLMDLKRQYDALSFLSRTFKRGVAGELAEQIVSAAAAVIESLTLIEKLFSDHGVEVSFANDIAALRKAP